MRYLLCIFSVLLSINSASAQVSGYQNKRFILKTDIMNYAIERGFNVSVEYAAFRRLSIGFEYKRVNRDYKQEYFHEAFWSGDLETPDEKAETVQNFWLFQFRFYGNSGLPAPKGFFTYLDLGYGSYDVKGITVRYESGLFEDNWVLVNYTANNIRVFDSELGWGYQWLLGKWVALEVSAGITSALSISGIAKEDVNSMDNHVGPNTFSFTGFNSGSGQTDWAFGPSVHLRLGVLLPF